jgi:hypothetical protein
LLLTSSDETYLLSEGYFSIKDMKTLTSAKSNIIIESQSLALAGTWTHTDE